MAEPRVYRKPVAWLGGRDLLANLKNFILFAMFQGKLDPRDWMKGEIFPPPLPDRSHKYYQSDKKYYEDFERSFGPETGAGRPKEFWFDYFADSGDGMTAGYAIAYLSLSDLTVNMPTGWQQMAPAQRSEAIKRDRAMAEARSRFAALEDPSRRLLPRFLRSLADSPKQILADLTNALDPEILSEVKRLSKLGNRQVIEYLEQTAFGVVNIPPADADTSAANCPLPRGAFLFIGGDTSYHVADFAGLGMRFQKVFDWAYEDLKKKFNLTEEQAKAKYWDDPVRRPIFAVPGNHDYYDMIDGFNRQFGRPITGETNFINLEGRDMSPQLRLRFFRRFQTASYVAIQLPMDWWFWGVDSELGVDIRQQEYFKRSFSTRDPDGARPQVTEQVIKDLRVDLKHEPSAEQIETEVKRRFPRIARVPHGDRWPVPEKLIIATSEPTTVEGRRARDDEDTQDKTAHAFQNLGLERPFLYLAGRAQSESDDQKAEHAKVKDREPKDLSSYRCRLDISGDVHHYARYWGNDTGENREAVTVDNYASVVCGGGGASMSPTQTDYGEIEEQIIYPDKKVSRRVVNSQLFRPWVVIRGGNVWMAGFIIAVIVAFGATSGGHLDFTNLITLNIFTNPPTDHPWPSLHQIATMIRPWDILKLVALLVLAGAGIVFAGLYIKFLFERLTGTHDWVRDKLENLRLAERLKNDRSLMEAAAIRLDKTYVNQTEVKAAADVAANRDYKNFLRAGRAVKSLEKDRNKLTPAEIAVEAEFEKKFGSTKQLESLYEQFLRRTETQQNPGVSVWRRAGFWIHSLGHLLLVIALWKIELHKESLGQIYSAMFIGVGVLMGVGSYLTYRFAKSLARELKSIESYQTTNSARNFWRVIQLSVHPKHDYVPFWALLLCPGLGVLLLAWWNYEHMSNLPRFANSVSILFATLVAGTAAGVANRYSGWLFEQAYRIKVTLFSYIPVMGLSAVALLTLVTAIVRCGRQEARYVLTDILFIAALLAVFGGCIYLAGWVGNHLEKWWRYLGFGLLGASHGILQLLVPFVLIWFGDGRTFGAALFVVALATALPVSLLSFRRLGLINKGPLLICWLVFGAIMLILIPWLWHRPLAGPWQLSEPVVMWSAAVCVAIITLAFARGSAMARLLAANIGWWVAALVMVLFYRSRPLEATWLLAGLIGAVMSCVWLGWYFAVALVFDGHANEAGSTARTEDYKQFIRFRLTEDSLTGFVIGVDFPYAPPTDKDPDGSALKPRLIDIFTLKCSPAKTSVRVSPDDQQFVQTAH